MGPPHPARAAALHGQNEKRCTFYDKMVLIMQWKHGPATRSTCSSLSADASHLEQRYFAAGLLYVVQVAYSACCQVRSQHTQLLRFEAAVASVLPEKLC